MAGRGRGKAINKTKLQHKVLQTAQDRSSTNIQRRSLEIKQYMAELAKAINRMIATLDQNQTKQFVTYLLAPMLFPCLVSPMPRGRAVSKSGNLLGSGRKKAQTARLTRERVLDLLQTVSLKVKQLLEKNENRHVVATCRNPNGATGLLELKNKFAERLNILQLDLTVESTIEASAKSIRERYGSLNLLINASGILSIPDVFQPETSLSKVQKSSLLLAYEVNAVGPILVIKHMWPLLKVGGGYGTERDVAVVANLSARVGSIGDNRLGGWHSYRSSKAALNQLTKTVSVEFARKKDPIICLLLHPGTVDTDLSRPFQRNIAEGKLFTKQFSVQKLLSIINGAKSHDNGKFFAWDGQEIPW
ncbi:hypothetical protein TEA_026051 [Camellia sinensis var. sinensis]|uniref:Uncharacterized protein n=1 Tax=Camellia sinensis var. sinensis TaxID=542762 RepID=A0A4S4ELV3_CAMSN|nr:hypothetical protein TEA_026051 [Camellia sinensis var. sinensis]